MLLPALEGHDCQLNGFRRLRLSTLALTQLAPEPQACAPGLTVPALNLLPLPFCQQLHEERCTMSELQVSTVGSQEKLVSDIRAVIADAEEMLKVTAGQTGEKIADLRVRIQDRLLGARIRLEAAEAVLVDKSRAAARAADEYVHESPWQAIGIGVSVGLLLGLALGRR